MTEQRTPYDAEIEERFKERSQFGPLDDEWAVRDALLERARGKREGYLRAVSEATQPALRDALEFYVSRAKDFPCIDAAAFAKAEAALSREHAAPGDAALLKVIEECRLKYASRTPSGEPLPPREVVRRMDVELALAHQNVAMYMRWYEEVKHLETANQQNVALREALTAVRRIKRDYAIEGSNDVYCTGCDGEAPDDGHSKIRHEANCAWATVDAALGAGEA
jgi:hypothetical protein